jgi:hypothetical protein
MKIIKTVTAILWLAVLFLHFVIEPDQMAESMSRARDTFVSLAGYIGRSIRRLLSP